MLCPYCKSKETKVIDKRDNETEPVSRRRRECEKCKKRFTTYERIENIELEVIKRSGRTEQFDRDKLRRGIARSVRKNISNDQIDEIVEQIELRLLEKQSKSVSSRDIGKYVLESLWKLDKLSYLRFATVYKDFKNLEDFEVELKKMIKSSS